MSTSAAPLPLPQSLLDFNVMFPNEAACERYFIAWRWPAGFRCRGCAGTEATRLSTRPVYQCRKCRRQTSLLAGTLLQDSKLGLRRWFLAFFLVGRHKQGVSALQLMNDLALGSYRSAWLLLQKVRSALDERLAWPLKGEVEVDETYIGAHEKGDAPGKRPGHKAIVVGAVALGEVSGARSGRRRGKHVWAGARLRHVKDLTKASLGGFVRDHVAQGSVLQTDDWNAYHHLGSEGFDHRTDTMSKYSRAEIREKDPLPHVQLLFSNLKIWLAGTFRGVSQQYLGRYLQEFTYRVNRRRDACGKLFEWVARRAAQAGRAPLAVIRHAASGT
jgi:transposase-like protein